MSEASADPLVGRAVRLFEFLGRTFGFTPLLNGARLKFMGLNLDYSIEKAQRELGYKASTSFDTVIRQCIDWLR